jgi:Sec-independent protein translocase protein TatA
MVFGPAKFPDLGKTLAAAIRGLRRSINELKECTFERSESPIPLKGSRL